MKRTICWRDVWFLLIFYDSFWFCMIPFDFRLKKTQGTQQWKHTKKDKAKKHYNIQISDRETQIWEVGIGTYLRSLKETLLLYFPESRLTTIMSTKHHWCDGICKYVITAANGAEVQKQERQGRKKGWLKERERERNRANSVLETGERSLRGLWLSDFGENWRGKQKVGGKR